jgi:hypothetical protein
MCAICFSCAGHDEVREFPDRGIATAVEFGFLHVDRALVMRDHHRDEIAVGSACHRCIL